VNKRTPPTQFGALANFAENSTRMKDTEYVLDRLFGIAPLRDPLPEDMPAIERMKHYARIGFDQYHIGGAEEFERTWNELFPAMKGGKR
jgi:hypothetical protein